jgi:hypothetical protein
MTQMQPPPTYFDQSKFKPDEPIKFRIKDIDSLQRALTRAGISEDTMKNVILTKEENGETHVQISVPIAELFKSMIDNDNADSNSTNEETSFTKPIFYNDIPKKDNTTLQPDFSIDVETKLVTSTTTTTTSEPSTTTTTSEIPTTTTVSTTISTTTSSTTTTTTTTKPVTTTTTEFTPKQVVLTKTENGVEEISESEPGVINLQKLTRPETEDGITKGYFYNSRCILNWGRGLNKVS